MTNFKYISKDLIPISKIKKCNIRTSNEQLLNLATYKQSFKVIINYYIFINNQVLAQVDILGLDCPGCDGVPDIIESDCDLRACAKHDECYDKNNCSASSWFHTYLVLACKKASRFCPMSFSACDKCNLAAVKSIAKCTIGKGGKTGAKFYCAKTHKYIKIPGDYPDRKCAEKCCCTK